MIQAHIQGYLMRFNLEETLNCNISITLMIQVQLSKSLLQIVSLMVMEQLLIWQGQAFEHSV